MGSMFPVPTSLSPSRVESFLSCPLQFRFASIEKLPEAPSIHATRGSLVHRALELLFVRPRPQRTRANAEADLATAIEEYRSDPEFTGLQLTDAQTTTFVGEARALIDSYFLMEDPTAVRDIGIELRLEAPAGALLLRGIIDRLELDDAGGLVVTDYKTGRAPSVNYEQSRLTGVHFYSFLCEALFGQRPAAIRLMYLSSREVITATPSAQSVRFVTTRTSAVLSAIGKACETGTFQPRTGALCKSCSFQQWCPAFGGVPELAAVEAPRMLGTVVAA
jgi:putative RecB family exonuclease